MILFTDSARIDLKILRHQYHLSARLLGIGFPLTIILGTLLALAYFTELSFWESAVLSTVLAPTDAALGQAVINHPQVPVRIRQAINVESVLNDAIATVPLLIIFLILSENITESESIIFLLSLVSKEIIFSPLVEISVGHLGGRLVHFGGQHNWMNQDL